MLTVYIDESGTHDNSPITVVGAFIGHTHVWERWTTEWNKQKSPINVYHSVDAHNRTGEFEGWEKSDRDNLVKRVLPVIGNEPFIGVAMGIDMREFDKSFRDRRDLLEIFPTPYAACLQWVLSHILKITDIPGSSQDNIIFIHEKNDFEKDASETFNFVQQYSNPRNREISLSFSSKSLEPLQAADVLAYEANHALRNPEAQTRLPWLAMDPKQNKIDLGFFGKNNMHIIVENLEAIKKMMDEN